MRSNALLALDLKIIDILFITLIARGRSLRDDRAHKIRLEPLLGLISPYALTREAAMTFATGSLNPVFRRRTEVAEEATSQDTLEPRKTAGKGRPTPKRREAERRSRQPITAPKDRKEAYKRLRERQAGDRAKARAGMAKGEEKYLPARDRGPVRKLARDYVDSRRTLSSNFMFILIAIMVVSFTQNFWAQIVAFFAMPAIILVVVVEGWFMARGVKRLAAERYPDESLSGIGWYTGMRSTQMRFLRMPKPQLKPGQQDQV
jgi:hypothetical protein